MKTTIATGPTFPVPAVRIILTAICYLLPCLAAAAPFGSWIDVKAECGAVGDGKADDTAAIQKGLDMIRPEDSKRKILYFPAGTYRITGALKAIREKHRECQGVGLQGEGPDQSVIVYDGSGNEPMLMWGSWYSTIRSLGFESADSETVRLRLGLGLSGGKSGKPTAGIWFGPGFSTANEVSDCAFRDLPIGIQGGTDKTQGQAEVAVEKCLFERCDFGLLLANWNSLDWWLWDCRFMECGTAVSNDPGCGNYNVYRSAFKNSKKRDCKIGNLGGFAFVENVSEGSQPFLISDRHSAGANLTLQGNRITRAKDDDSPRDPGSISIGHPGPNLLLGNTFTRHADLPGPDLWFGAGNNTDPSGFALLIENQTTGTNLVQTTGKYRVLNLEERTAMSEPGKNELATFPRPARLSSPSTAAVELAAGSGDEEIQAAMDGAKAGTVIHLPAGTYRLDQSLVVKTGKSIILQGDGLLNATTLVPGRGFGEKGLIEVQPGGRLEARDLALQAPMQGGGVVGMIVRTDDTEEVKVVGNQVQTKGFGPGLVVEGLDYGRVVLRNHGHNGMTVFGGPRLAKGEAVPGRVEILCGASSRDGNLKPETPIYDVRQGGRILVRDIWYEGDPPEFMQVRDRGDIVFVGGHVAPNKGKGHSAANAIQMNGKGGSVLLAQAALNGADLKIGKLAEGFFVTLFGLTPYPETRISYGDPSFGISEIRVADSSLSKSLSLSCETDSKTPGFVQMMCRQNNTKITGSEPLADVNAEGEVVERFRILREWKLPAADLDAPVKLHRVSCTGSIGLVVVKAGKNK